MKIIIAAIGKAKATPAQALYLDYTKRLPWKIDCREFDIKLSDPVQRKEREGELLLEATEKCTKRIALDESGRQLSSREFAVQIGNWQQQGASSLGLMIGGADGLSESVLKASQLVWSLGRVTWPHMLMRPLLAEQLYRAYSVLTNHPYHRD